MSQQELVRQAIDELFGKRDIAFYDLFRVKDGKLAEHWDVVFIQPATLPHGNGLF